MPTTRLAAIMFTDIVGYTAMMQSDRDQAMTAVKQHETILEQRIKANGGELIQTYGDGSLSVFESASAAVQCAKEIQEQVRNHVPLRIGIHLGEITRDGKHTFGDGVNIASRVESMGKAGAVLLSSSVRQQIKNKPEFELLSLGKFSFKNVAEPMTVYALSNAGFAVPKSAEMKGKGEKLVDGKVASQSVLRMASIGFVAMLIGALLFWAVGSMEAKKEGPLDAKIIQERVAAIPFSNRTGDNNLDAFGALCSDLITNGLTEAGIKTCSPRTIQQYSHLIGILPNDPEGKTSFSEVVGARFWIDGSFLQRNDSLIIESQLIDGFNGDVIRNFPTTQRHIREKERLADELTRRIMGFWVAKEEIEKGKFRVPKYEAFQEYNKGFQLQDGIVDHRILQTVQSHKAFELDSSFYWAALNELYWVANAGNHDRIDSLTQVLSLRYDKMTPYEQGFFNACNALNAKDWSLYGKILADLNQLFPKDFSIIQHLSWTLAMRENRPNDAWQVENKIDLTNIPPELNGWRVNRVSFKSQYGLMAGKYEAVIQEVDAYLLPDQSPYIQGIYYLLKSTALLRLGQLDSIYSLVDEIKQVNKASHWFKPEYDLVDFCNHAANELLVMGKTEEANKFLDIAILWTLEKPERMSSLYDSLDLAESYRLLGQHDKASSLSKPYVDKYLKNKYQAGVLPSWIHSHYLSGIAIDYAVLGEDRKAKELADRLFQAFAGGNWYAAPCAARVYAVLGKKDKAMAYLKLEKQNGGSINYPFYFKHDYFMKNLFDHPPFEEMVRLRN